MLAEVRKEVLPMLIVVALFVAALRYWLASVPIPDDLSILLTSVVMFYFGTRTGQAAASRALNGSGATVAADNP